jgi:hypothetical protein
MWGVLPTFLAMCGIAMLRIAELIIEKRHSNNAHSILQMASISHAFLTIYVEIANPLGTV